jgi:hypothetical protein
VTTATPEAELTQGSASFTVEGNEAELTVTSKGEPIKTLEELIASHQIDTDVWVVAGKVTHNVWSTPAFDRDAEAWTYFQNHQVKAPFAKKNPDPVFPQVQPVEPHKVYPAPDVTFQEGQIVRQLLLADLHIGYRKCPYSAKLTPFHDRRALDLVVQLATVTEPDQVVILGDAIDAAELSDKYPRDPDMLATLQPALVELYWWLDQLRCAVSRDCEIDYEEGNHEERLRRWLVAHFPAVYGMKRADALDLPPVLSFANLIALDALKVKWIAGYPKEELWMEGLRARHGDTARKNPGSTGWAILQDADTNEAFAHTHRDELVTKSIYNRHGRRVVRAFNPGCLCHVDGRVPGSSPEDYWAQGVVLRDVVAGQDTSEESFIHIHEGQMVYDRKRFTARHRTDDLKTAFPRFNW